MSVLANRILALCILFFPLFIAVSPASAQSAAEEQSRVAEQSFVRMERSTPALTAKSADLGRVEAGKNIERMLLMLSPSAEKEAALQLFLDQQQNPASANFHHWLTPAEFGAQFGADGADLQRVRNWLEGNGFRISAEAKSGRWIEFAGTSSQVENAFRTELHYFRLAGKQYLANATDISLPSSIAQISHGLVSLNNFPKRPPTQRPAGIAGITAQGQKVRLAPNLTAVGNTNTFYLAPGDFAAIYNTKPLLAGGNDGSGISIAITAQSQIELTDVEAFRQIFRLKTNDPNIFVSGPDPGFGASIDQQEATLDVEWAGAVAPGATINLVIAGSTDSTNGVDLAAVYAIDNQIAPILTYTYGSCEQSLNASGNAFYNALWQQAAAEGITVLVATGDNGSAGCDADASGSAATRGMSVNGAASTPFNVAVGGTQFNDTAAPATYWSGSNNADYSSAIGYIPESAWNESCDTTQPTGPINCFFSNVNFSTLASGGGASTIYAKPSWQSGAGVPADGFRDIPDVALAAASGHDDIVYCNSQGGPGSACEINAQNQVVGLTLVGGTSASTPAMAGILALIEAKNGAYQGQINYTLYKLAQNTGASCDSSKQTNPTAQNSCVFYDVTSGSNAIPCAGGSPGCSSAQAAIDGFMTGHAAGPGYDLATGLGSVNATNLANAWSSVSFQASQTTLLIPTATFTHGTAIPISGTVSAASGTGIPTGSVSLATNSFGSADTLPIAAGTFSSAAIRDLPGGQYSVTARYGGDGTFAVSNSNSVTVNVAPEASSTTLSTSGLQAGSTPYGDPVELIATVQGASGAGIATGSVTLQDGANLIGTYPLAANGAAHIYTGSGGSFSFSVGTHTLTVSYSGDNSFNASNSSTIAFTVSKSTPVVVLGLNMNSVSITEPVVAHTNVAGFGTALATGQVQFLVDGVAYGPSIALQAGGLFNSQAQASILITGLKVGTHSIGVNYDGSGDPNFLSVLNGAQNNQQTVTVTPTSGISTTTALTATPPPASLGDTGTFNVAITPPAASGTVTLWDAVGPRGSATKIIGGTATILFQWTQAGNITLYAVYSGDATHAASASPPVLFTVKPGVTQIAITAPTTITSNQQVSIVASVTGLTSSHMPASAPLPNPSGAIEFWDSFNGGAPQLISTQILTVGAADTGTFGLRTKLPIGTHVLSAHYLGDTNWQAGVSPNITLNSTQAPDFTVVASPNPVNITAPASGSTTITVTPTGGFTGPVTLSCPLPVSFPLAGYSCSFTPSATVTITNGNAATANLNLIPPVGATGAIASATASSSATSGSGSARRFAAASFFAGLFLLVFVAFRSGNSRTMRQLAFASGCVVCAASLVIGCGGGGGGGGGGGPVPSTTSLTSSNLHILYQTPLTLGVKISANSTPGGSVNLIDNGAIYSSGIVSSGIASFQTTSIPIGVHVITAQYSGDANTQPSSSSAITQIVTGTVKGFAVTATSSAGTHTAYFDVNLN